MWKEIIAGLLMIVLTFMGLLKTWALIGLLLVTTLVPCVYSFWLHMAKGL